MTSYQPAPPPYQEKFPEKPQGMAPQLSPPVPGMVLDAPHVVPGYENISFKEGGVIAPPTAPEWDLDHPPERQEITGIPKISEEEVRDAVLQYVDNQCCYGRDTAANMIISAIKMKSAFHYTFQTFGEKRETMWRYVPYIGQVIDGPMNGPAPGPWEMMVIPDSMFASNQKAVEVPHTAFVKTCHNCYGTGKVTCPSCSGSGSHSSTDSEGRRTSSSCMRCGGSGRVTCETCEGHCNLKGFVQLNVIWTNHHENYISDTCALPKEKLLDVTGKFVFEEENERIWPISHSGDPAVDQASRFLIQKHSTDFTTEKILRQRHTLRSVPLAEVDYVWKNKSGSFYIYGYENKVYFDNYPQRCCWSCNIL